VSQPSNPAAKVDLRNPYLAAFLAWLVPGLGHAYQGRRGKAALYFVCIVGLFVLGLIVGDGKVVYWRWVNPMRDAENFRVSYIFQFFAGLPALPALLQATLRHWGMDPVLWGFLDAPPMTEVFALHPKLGKLVEVGWVYAIIAGLLNILAIYDAFAGPALAEEEAGASTEVEPAPDGGKARITRTA
jgi:hypothetical protein